MKFFITKILYSKIIKSNKEIPRNYVYICFLSKVNAYIISGYTGEKAIGTGWTVAPPEEEESNWGGTTLTM